MRTSSGMTCWPPSPLRPGWPGPGGCSRWGREVPGRRSTPPACDRMADCRRLRRRPHVGPGGEKLADLIMRLVATLLLACLGLFAGPAGAAPAGKPNIIVFLEIGRAHV